MSEGLSFHPSPSRPRYRPPPGAVDAHCHVFGPAAVFPFAPERKYTPADAPKERLFALHEHLGLSRSVIVQATCHGRDNSALLDALRGSGGTARGVAILDPEIADDALDELGEAGVCAVRLNFLKRLVDATPRKVYETIARRAADRGWHIVVYFESEELAELEPFLNDLPRPLVIDHMGRPDVREGLEGASFERVQAFLDANPDAYVKVSCPERLTHDGPPYADVVPFARRLTERYSERVLWGTDWPHPNMRSHVPDDGALVDLLPQIAPTEDLRQKLLVDNPERLYFARGDAL